MADVLSQSEVESLLAALDPSAEGGESASPASSHSDSFDFGSQVSVYDFKRPERVSKDQMRALQALHEGFSREFGAGLSGMLRTIVEVKLISVDQLTYSEFVFSLENPSCFNLLHSQGLDGHFILDLNPSIIYPIVDRLLGGGKEVTFTLPNRPLTEIELRLVKRILDLAISGLENAWRSICDLKLRVTQTESNPQLVQIVPPNEVTVLISFEITMGDTRGIMNLCVPFNTIEVLAPKLSSDTWAAYSKKDLTPRQRLDLRTGISRAKVSMVVNLAETTISAGELLNLSVGDVIVTEKEHDSPLEVCIEGRPMFHATAGLYRGRKAIRVTSQIAHPRELIERRLKELEQSGRQNQSAADADSPSGDTPNSLPIDAGVVI